MRRGGSQQIPRPPATRPGGPAPWADLDSERRRLHLADVRERLHVLPPARPLEQPPGSRPAAVLVPLFEEDGEVRLVLTKRPDTMPSHRGEIAFPGGTYDPDVDVSLRDTALREAEEEIGLPPGVVEVAGPLDGLATVGSRFTITPFVGLLDDRPTLVADPTEVTKVFDVALSELLDDAVFRAERWAGRDPAWVVYFFELVDETVWGATARILTSFLAHLLGVPMRAGEG